MSALSTRLLILGVVARFGPANGYQLRRELRSWEVERWARLKPGSVYSMLSGLDRAGLVRRDDIVPDGTDRSVAVYSITEAGRDEFRRMLREAISDVPESGDLLPLRAALSFAPALTRSEFLAAVDARLSATVARREEFVASKSALVDDGRVPPHIGMAFELEIALLDTQLVWLAGVLESVREGAPGFADEPDEEWTPPDDHPAWRMLRERERYLRILAQSADRIH